MSTFVALFRAINVGGKNILPMKDLALLMTGMGCENVTTYIQSGNVVFQAARTRRANLVAKLRDAIHERFGFSPELILLDEAALDRAISENPFREVDAEPNKVHVTFLFALPSDPDVQALERIRRPNERWVLKGDVFYLHAPDGIGKSKLAARIEKSLGVHGTSRNWRTVRTLQELVRRCA